MNWWDWVKDAVKDLGLLIGTLVAALGFAKNWWMPYYRRWRERRKAKAAVPSTLVDLAASLQRIERTGETTLDQTTMLHGMVRHQADSHADAVFETDAAGLNVWVNANYLRWTGMQLDQLRGWGWINAIAYADRDRVRAEWEDALAEARTFTATYHLLDATGRPFEVAVKATPLRNRAGEVVKWMGNITLVGVHPQVPAR